MSVPIKNQKDNDLSNKVEGTIADNSQQQQPEQSVPINLEVSDVVGINSVHRGLGGSVSGITQIRDSPQEPACLPTHFASVIASQIPRPVQYYSFADLETNSRSDQDLTEVILGRAVNSFTDITSGTGANDHTDSNQNNYSSSITDNSDVHNDESTGDDCALTNTPTSERRDIIGVNSKDTENTGKNHTSGFTYSKEYHHTINLNDNTCNNNFSILTGGKSDKCPSSSTCSSINNRTANITDSDNTNIKQKEQSLCDILKADTTENVSKVSDISPTLIRCIDIPSQTPEIPHTKAETKVSSEPALSRFELQSVEEINTQVDCIPADSILTTSYIPVEQQQQLTQNQSEPISPQIELKSPVQSRFKSISQAEPASVDEETPNLSPLINPEKAITSELELIHQKLPETTSQDKLELFISGGIELNPNTPIESDLHSPIQIKAATKSVHGPVSHSGHEPPTANNPMLLSQDNILVVGDSNEPLEKPIKKKDPRGRKTKAFTNQNTGLNYSSKLEKAPAKNKTAKASHHFKASTSAPVPLKKSKRQAEKQAAIKAAEEEAERQAAEEEAERQAAEEKAERQAAAAEAETLRLEEIERQAGNNEHVKAVQQSESFEQARNTQQTDAFVETFTEGKALNKSDVIELSDTETVSSPKKPREKKVASKKIKKSPVKARTNIQDTSMADIPTENIMLDSIIPRISIKKKLSGDNDGTDEYIPAQITNTIHASLSGRKRRATTSTVSYKDEYDEYSDDEETDFINWEKKMPAKDKSALARSSKAVKKTPKTSVRPKRVSTKAKLAKEDTHIDQAIYIDTDDEVKETEIAQIKSSKKKESSDEDKINMLLQSRESKLTKVDFRDLIPGWLEELTEKDIQELVLLLPEPDRVFKNNHISIRPDFGKVSTNHFYEAIEKWQDILFLGGFEPNRDVVADTVQDSFKDENYEEHWGERISKFNAEKRKHEEYEQNMPRRKRTKGKGKAATAHK